VSKLLWRVKLVAERQPGVTTETELAGIERDAQAGLADLGLSLAEAKQLTAALQAALRANDDETSSSRKFSLEGAEGSSCSCP